MIREFFLHCSFELIPILDLHSLSVMEDVTVCSGEKSYWITEVILEFEVVLMEGFIVVWGRCNVCTECTGLWNIFITIKIVEFHILLRHTV